MNVKTDKTLAWEEFFARLKQLTREEVLGGIYFHVCFCFFILVYFYNFYKKEIQKEQKRLSEEISELLATFECLKFIDA